MEGDEIALNPKLAEYIFFPLSHLFNEASRAPARALELALRCLQLLIEQGWGPRGLGSEMAKQLLILLGFITGGVGVPGQSNTGAPGRSEEVVVAALDCIGAICTVAGAPAAAAAGMFNELEAATTIDRTVYVLLEALTDSRAENLQMAAASSLRALDARVTDRVVLASLMPRTVSSLTQVLRPTTEVRRSFRVVRVSLQTLTEMLMAVLNDQACEKGEEWSRRKGANDIVLDASWRKATASQVKLALANVIPLRSHERVDVRRDLLELCLMVVERCPRSLAESVPMMIETIVVIAGIDEQGDAYTALKTLAMSSDEVMNIIKSSLHAWIAALPRLMESNNDKARHRAIRQISTAFSVVAQTSSTLDVLDTSLATSLCDSVTAAMVASSSAPEPVPPTLELANLGENPTFGAVVLTHQSQQDTLSELNTLLSRLAAVDTPLVMANSLLQRLYGVTDETLIAPFWLTLSLLRHPPPAADVAFEDFLAVEPAGPTRASLVEELYAFALPLLTELSPSQDHDWRIVCLALEAVALEAEKLGSAFRPELVDALYPVLQLMGATNTHVQSHATTCLELLTAACGYESTSAMLVDNVDYLVNAIGLKLNTFDVSPQTPQVLLLMVRLCGASLIPYLDDLVDSIFAILDAFHGYPRLVELLFAVLGSIVSEGAKKPEFLALAESDSTTTIGGKRCPQPQTIADVARSIHRRKKMQHELFSDALRTGDGDGPLKPEYYLLGPHGSKVPLPKPEQDDNVELGYEADPEDQTEQMPAAKSDGEKQPHQPSSKTHALLLQIVRSIPPHLTSPSPLLRRSLLEILAEAVPVLARHQDSFLPLVNDVWPAVSARLMVSVFEQRLQRHQQPERQTSSSTPLLVTSVTAEQSTANDLQGTLDEAGIREETHVAAVACRAVAAICAGCAAGPAGSSTFMASRIEHEWPQWSRVYGQAWARVRSESERAAARMMETKEREDSRLQHIDDAQEGMSMLTLISRGRGDGQAVAATASIRPPFPSKTKTFSTHHVLWRAFGALLVAVLAHVRLANDDMTDQIVEWLTESVAFYVPTYYFRGHWRTSSSEGGDGNSKGKKTTSVKGLDDETRAELDAAIRTMDAYNPDLTWLLFERYKRLFGSDGDDDLDRLVAAKKRLDALVGGGLEAGVASMNFAEVTF